MPTHFHWFYATGMLMSSGTAAGSRPGLRESKLLPWTFMPPVLPVVEEHHEQVPADVGADGDAESAPDEQYTPPHTGKCEEY